MKTLTCKEITSSSLPHKFFYCLLVLYLIGTTNFDLFGNQNWHDQQRIGQGVFYIFLYGIWAGLQAYIHHMSRHVDVSGTSALTNCGLAGFAFIGLISAVQAQYLHWALIEWSLIVFLLLAIFMVAHFRIEGGEGFDNILVIIIVATCMTYLVGFAAAYSAILMGASLYVWDLFHGFGNVRFFGQFQTMTLPLLVVPVYCSRSKVQKAGAISLLAIWWMLSIASGTRGTWLGMLVAAGFLAGSRWKLSYIWLLRQIQGIAIGLVLYWGLFYVIPHYLGSDSQLIDRLANISTLSRREIIWGEAWELIKSHPVLGIGPMHFASMPNGVGAHPHNVILQIASEWGIPAMLLLAIVAIRGLWKFVVLIHHQDRVLHQPSMLGTALLASMIAIAVQGLVDGVMVMPYSQVFLIIVIGWARGMYFSQLKPELSRLSSFGRTSMIGISGAVVLIVLIGMSIPELLKLEKREKEYTSQHGDYLLPRFWRQGWISE